ncbi:MAG: hypothetical protein HN348_00560 [Proteobacteria bacterium]|jgi:hypothetical protein|nr:hypothetical protein [Pseudomonadota bacterium]
MKRNIASFLSFVVLLGEAAAVFVLALAILYDLVTHSYGGGVDGLVLGAVLVAVHLIAAGFLSLTAAVVAYTRRFEMAPVAAFVGWFGSMMFAAYCCPGVVCVFAAVVVMVVAMAVPGGRKP